MQNYRGTVRRHRIKKTFPGCIDTCPYRTFLSIFQGWIDRWLYRIKKGDYKTFFIRGHAFLASIPASSCNLLIELFFKANGKVLVNKMERQFICQNLFHPFFALANFNFQSPLFLNDLFGAGNVTTTAAKSQNATGQVLAAGFIALKVMVKIFFFGFQSTQLTLISFQLPGKFLVFLLINTDHLVPLANTILIPLQPFLNPAQQNNTQQPFHAHFDLFNSVLVSEFFNLLAIKEKEGGDMGGDKMVIKDFRKSLFTHRLPVTAGADSYQASVFLSIPVALFVKKPSAANRKSFFRARKNSHLNAHVVATHFKGAAIERPFEKTGIPSTFFGEIKTSACQMWHGVLTIQAKIQSFQQGSFAIPIHPTDQN